MNTSIFKLDADLLPKTAETLKALGHPHRLRILEALADDEKTVGTLADLLDLPQAIVSQQLRIMRTSQVVVFRRHKSQSIYSLAHPGLSNLLHCLRSCQAHCAGQVPPSPQENSHG